jgi:hypothetical protein
VLHVLVDLFECFVANCSHPVGMVQLVPEVKGSFAGGPLPNPVLLGGVGASVLEDLTLSLGQYCAR